MVTIFPRIIDSYQKKTCNRLHVGSICTSRESWLQFRLHNRNYLITGGELYNLLKILAERVGFEPTVPFRTTVFETVRIGRSRTSPPDMILDKNWLRLAKLLKELL